MSGSSATGSATKKELTVTSFVNPLQAFLDPNGQDRHRYVLLPGEQLPNGKPMVAHNFEGTVHHKPTPPQQPPGVLKAPTDSYELSYLKEAKEEVSKEPKGMLIPGGLPRIGFSNDYHPVTARYLKIHQEAKTVYSMEEDDNGYNENYTAFSHPIGL